MGERDDAKRSVESSRARIGVLAHEVSRRMTPGYAKERAREMARDKAYEMRDRAAERPWMLPLLGAGIGALLGKALTSRAQERRDRYGWDDRYDRYGRGDRLYGRGDRYSGRGDGYGLRDVERYEVWSGEDSGVIGRDDDSAFDVEASSGSSSGLRDRAEDVKERASEMKDRASDKVSEVKDRIVGRASDVSDRVRSRASDVSDRMRSRAYDLRDRMPGSEDLRANAQENPAFWAFGALAVGAVLGLLLPVTESERRALAPAKEKLREASQQAAQTVSDKVSEKMGQSGANDRQGESFSTTEGRGDTFASTTGAGMGAPAPMTPSSGAGATGPDILPPTDPLH